MRYINSLALSYFQQAAVCYQQARYVESIQYYLAGLRYAPGHHYIYADLAKAYEMIGKWEQALAYLDIALRLCPDSPTALRRKTRIDQEKRCYQTLIRESNLVEHPPVDFLPTAASENGSRAQTVVEHVFFKLTVEPTVRPKTLWNLSQLIEKTYAEVGNHLGRYPEHKVSISIINACAATSQRPLPKWAAGCYDGDIQLSYCADGEPELGVLYALIRHEWTHLLVHTLTHQKCPVWLDEGLAQTIARPLLSFEKEALQKAYKKGHLLTMAELSQPFSQIPASQRQTAYLQAAAIVEMLIHEGSFVAIRHLLDSLGKGIPIEIAMWQTFAKRMRDIPLTGRAN